MAAEFEEMLQMSGGFGRYQWFLYMFYMIVMLEVVSQDGFMIFGKLEPADEELCHFRNRSWYNGSVFTNETMCTEIRFYSVTMEFDLIGPRFWIQGFIISIPFVSDTLSSLVSGQVSDRFGRKTPFISCFVILVCLSIGSSFSPNWESFIFFRFLIGVLLPPIYSPLAVLCSESVPQKWRYFMSMGGWSIGYIFLSLLAYYFRNWRHLLIATNITAPFALIFVYWIHESPKWLIEKGRFSEAVSIFKSIGKWNRVPNWDKETFYRVEEKLKTMKIAKQAFKDKQSFLTYRHLFYDWNAAKVLVSIIVARCIFLSVYFGLLFNTGKLSGDVSLNLSLIMLIRTSITFTAFLLDKNFYIIGRRHLSLIGTMIAWLCMIFSMIAYMTSLWETVPITLNITAYAGIGFLMVANGVINELSLIETTPTLLRSMGVSLVSCLAQFFAMSGPQIILLFDIWKAGPSLIFLLELTIAVLVVFIILPETKGRPLPDLPLKFSLQKCLGNSRSGLNEEESFL